MRLLTKKTFFLSYQQTILGPLWIIVNPILSSCLYMFLFGYVANIGTGGTPRILFYFVSSAAWEILAVSLISNANTFVVNANLFSKVYFPRLSVPISHMLVSLLKFLVQLIIIMTIQLIYVVNGEVHPNWALYPLLPFLILQMAILGMSAGILLSSLTTKYRDLLVVVTLGVNMWMYASPVVYPLSEMPAGVIKTIIKLNPVSELLEMIRMIMLGEGEVELSYFVIGVIITILLFVVSVVTFNHVEKTFVDTV